MNIILCYSQRLSNLANHQSIKLKAGHQNELDVLELHVLYSVERPHEVYDGVIRVTHGMWHQQGYSSRGKTVRPKTIFML